MVKARIHVYEYKMFEYAKIACSLFDENDKLIENRTFVIDKTNGFDDWNSDDKYLVNWIKQKLNPDI